MGIRRTIVTGLLAALRRRPSPPSGRPIAAAIAERAKSCAEAGGKLAAPEKAIRRLDLDGDGRDDFILDDRRLACSRGAPGWCGFGGCSIEVFLSSAGG